MRSNFRKRSGQLLGRSRGTFPGQCLPALDGERTRWLLLTSVWIRVTSRVFATLHLWRSTGPKAGWARCVCPWGSERGVLMPGSLSCAVWVSGCVQGLSPGPEGPRLSGCLKKCQACSFYFSPLVEPLLAGTRCLGKSVSFLLHSKIDHRSSGVRQPGFKSSSTVWLSLSNSKPWCPYLWERLPTCLPYLRGTVL